MTEFTVAPDETDIEGQEVLLYRSELLCVLWNNQ